MSQRKRRIERRGGAYAAPHTSANNYNNYDIGFLCVTTMPRTRRVPGRFVSFFSFILGVYTVGCHDLYDYPSMFCTIDLLTCIMRMTKLTG